MVELAVSFGSDNALMGVISQPEKKIRKQSPIVIILNSGLLHKVGPFRLSVELARSFTREGFVVLRLDISGIGDSKLRLQKPNEDAAVKDVQTAMDYLSSIYHKNTFVLMGLCSGSDNSHRTAIVDQRVIGTAHIDGYGFTNRMYYAKYYLPRFASPKVLLRKAKAFFTNIRVPAETRNPDADAIVREFPAQEQVIKEFSILVGRNVQMLYIYTRGVEDYYIYKNQLKHNVAPVNCDKNLEIEYYKYDDHTYSRTRERTKVVTRITEWLLNHY